MQYLNYALQTSTRLLTSQSNNHSQPQTQTQTQTQAQTQTLTAAQEAAAEAEAKAEDQIAHACCSRGAQLLRLRQQELAKRRALELEDQLNANAIRCAQNKDEDEDAYSEASSGPEEGAVGGHREESTPQQPVQ
ncbi:hypothetical protein ACLKA7_013117 [Drosophila subpalustris]